MNDLFQNAYNSLKTWIEKNGQASYDILDLKTTGFFIFFIQLGSKYRVFKPFSAVFIILSERCQRILRILFLTPKKHYAQSYAITARAYLATYKKTGENQNLEKARQLLQWLEEHPSKGYPVYCWGQPYNWLSRKVIPKHTPRATVTSQVANAFIDAYEITGNQKYLEIASQASHFFIDHLNWNNDKDGDICFSYTSADHFHIHNASMLGAALLIRTWFHTKNEKFREMGIKAMNFTIKHQNNNGSWYYWAPPDKIVGKIDHYHTGFVLEAFADIKKYLGKDFIYDEVLQKGLDFYLKELFHNENIPKMTDKSLYPIDIQSCAQAIITLGELQNEKPALIERAMMVGKWTINNMQDKKGYFYYRIFKNQRKDKTPYMRWSESWMMRALTYLLEKKS